MALSITLISHCKWVDVPHPDIGMVVGAECRILKQLYTLFFGTYSPMFPLGKIFPSAGASGNIYPAGNIGEISLSIQIKSHTFVLYHLKHSLTKKQNSKAQNQCFLKEADQ